MPKVGQPHCPMPRGVAQASLSLAPVPEVAGNVPGCQYPDATPGSLNSCPSTLGLIRDIHDPRSRLTGAPLSPRAASLSRLSLSSVLDADRSKAEPQQ